MISLLLLFIAGLCNGMMDRISFRWRKGTPEWMHKRYKFWNPKKSHFNKWKKDSKGYAIVGEERFKFSSTLFVFLTSGWHLLKEIMISNICITLSIHTTLSIEGYNIHSIFIFIVYRLLIYSGFKLIYR